MGSHMLKTITYQADLAKKKAADEKKRLKFKDRPVRPQKAPRATKKLRVKNPITKAKKKVWELCKALVRLRQVKQDGTWDCYTCGINITNPSDAHTAHFIPSSVCGAGLRYDLANLRVCCGKCNIWLSGNWTSYYEHLLKDIGSEAVTNLMNRRREIVKADAHFYNEIINRYTQILGHLNS